MSCYSRGRLVSLSCFYKCLRVSGKGVGKVVDRAGEDKQREEPQEETGSRQKDDVGSG